MKPQLRLLKSRRHLGTALVTKMEMVVMLMTLAASMIWKLEMFLTAHLPLLPAHPPDHQQRGQGRRRSAPVQQICVQMQIAGHFPMLFARQKLWTQDAAGAYQSST